MIFALIVIYIYVANNKLYVLVFSGYLSLPQYITSDYIFAISDVANNVQASEIALGVVIPVLIIIIIALVAYMIKKLHPQLLRKSTTGNPSTHCYENQDFKSVSKYSKPEKKAQANASESAYDEIDATDINMSSNAYDIVDTDKVEYETVQ